MRMTSGKHCAVAPCRYASLRVNLPREIMSYTDFPFIPEAMAGKSEDARRFPHHTEVWSPCAASAC